VALGVGGAALGLAVTGSSSAQAAGCGGPGPKLTVQGSGMATGTPDLLTVSVGIDVTRPTAQVSLADDNTKASAVTTALTRGGVADKDVQTSNVSIQPHYDLGGNITGYEMTNTLTAKLRNFGSAGGVVDALAQAAGNSARINSLSFSIEDPRRVEDQARNDAVHQAVSHARSMAQAAGERLGSVCSLTDDSSLGYVPFAANAGVSAAPALHAAVPLQPGTQQASAQITMVYALEAPPRS
jgi:uncharacterized protein YggE